MGVKFNCCDLHDLVIKMLLDNMIHTKISQNAIVLAI